jgi:hypothetical protein
MAFGALLAIVLVAEIAVHVEEAGELERAEAAAIAEQLARAFETRTSSTARVEDPAWWGCPEESEDRCVREVRARSGAADVVVLRLFGGARSVRVIADRYAEQASAPKNATIDLARTSTVWDQTIGELAAALFPEARGRREGSAVASMIAAPSGESSSLHYVLFGAGAASAAVSAVLWITAQNARSELESDVHPYAEYDSLNSRMRTHALLSGALMITAGVAIVAGVISWLLAEPSVDLPSERGDQGSHAFAF